MFTGIVKDIGKIIKVSQTIEGKQFILSAPNLVDQVEVDDSISINGVCQTAIKVNGSEITFDTVKTTLNKTTLGSLKVNDHVNLELALRLSDRLGGHFVTGHANGTAQIFSIQNKGQNFELGLRVSDHLLKYLVTEGSITIDGVSLTISNKVMNHIYVSVIPHTFNQTIFKNSKIGDHVNIEVDILAKYIEQLLPTMKSNRPIQNLDEFLSDDNHRDLHV